MAFNAMELCVKIFADSSEAEKTVGGLGDKLQGALGTAAKVGAAAIGAASTAVGGFAVASVKAGGDFDKAMAQVAATSGKTVSEIGNLRDFAQQMGSTTAFSATEAAEALNYMALAGYDADTSMEMLPNVLNLAAAGSIELGAASDMVTDAQTALGLSLEQTSTMVDQMAVASSKTNTSVGQLGEAFLTIGANARDLSGGTTELSSALGILADNGIKGSEAGTHLRNIMMSMTPTTTDAVAAWERLGVTAYDADGNLRPLQDTFADLNKAMDGMSTEEKTQTLSDMFNKTDLASINALLGTSADRWDELGVALENAGGAAETMANTQLDNLQGDLTLFGSALEGFQIAVSDALTPALREFVQFGSESLSAITEGFKTGDMDAVFQGVGQLITNLVVKISEMLPQMVEAGVKILGAIIEGLINATPQLANAGMMLVDTLWTTFTSNLVALFPESEGLLGQLADTFTSSFDQIVRIVQTAWELIQAIWNTFGDIITNYVSVWFDSLSMIFSGALSIIEGILNIALGLISGDWSKAWDGIKSVFEGIMKVIQGILQQMLNLYASIINAALTLIATIWQNMWNSISQFFTNIMNNINTALQNSEQAFINGANNLYTTIVTKIGEAMAYIKDLPAQALQWGKDLIDNFVSGIKEKWNALKDTISDVADSIADFIGFSEPKRGSLSRFHTFAPDMMELFAQGINENKHLITDAIQNSFDIESTIAGATGQNNAMNITQNIYSKAMTASELMREARYEHERAVLMG